MKKIIPFFLLVIFLFNTVGYVFFFQSVRNSIKKEMRGFIRSKDKEDLVELRIAAADTGKIQWLDGGEEMRYKGHMYDIARLKKTKDGLVVYCIKDDKEEKLNKTFAETQSDDQLPGNHKKENTVKKSEIKLYVTVQPDISLPSHLSSSAPANKISSYISRYPEITSPPPELR